MIADELVADVVREGLGLRVVGVERVRGGSKKGAYRVGLDDGASAVLYVWAGEENYWPDDDEVEPFAHASGFELFEASHRRG